MPQARDEAGNIWETDAQGNPVRLLQPAGGGRQATIITNPYRQREEGRKEEDQGFQREQVGISARSVANSERATNLAERRFEAEELARQREEERKRNPSITAQQRIDLEAKRGTLANLASGISSLKSQYAANFKGRSAAEYLPAVVRPENGVFNDKSGSLSAYVAAALGLSGQQFNTPAEQQLFIGSILPKAGDTDQQIEAKLGTLEELLRNADNTSASQLGVKPIYQGGPTPPSSGDVPPPTIRGYENDPSGGRSFQTEADRTYQNEAEAAFKAGASREQMDAIARKYGAPAFGPDLDQAIQQRQANPAAPVGFTTPASGREEAGLTAGFANMLPSGVGSYLAGAANGLTAGQLGNIAQLTGSSEGGTDVAMGMAKDNPLSYMAGGLTGDTLGALGLGSALGNVAGRVANPSLAAFLGNPLTSDTIYGAAMGAGSADDPLYGAVGGALVGAGGSALGSKIGGMIGGSRTPQGIEALNPGEQALMRAINETGAGPVEAALLRAQELGVPASLADVSPQVNALTGSAIRANPTVAGQARDTLSQRSAGQIDRFRGAVGRDLGPLDNVPQRSDELIKRAQSNAGPLYEQAYANTVPNTPTIEELLSTPFGRQASGRARTIAANERRDPSTMGFALDAEGNTILTPYQPMTLTSAGQAGGDIVEQPVYSMQTLDYVKRGMDDVLEQYRNPITGKLQLDEAGRAQNDVLRSLLGEIDILNPSYGQARAAYAGPAGEREALRMGQDAITQNTDMLAIQAGRQTPERLEQMQLGARDSLVKNAERLRNSANPFDTLNSPAMERRLSALYPEGGDQIARLLAQRDLERQLAGSTNRLVGNSATAERSAADAAFSDEGSLRPVLEGGVETAISGVPTMTILRSLANSGLGQKLTSGSRQRASSRAEQIVPLALNTDPGDSIAQILALATRASEMEAAKSALAQSGRRPGSAIGTGLGTSILSLLAGQ